MKQSHTLEKLQNADQISPWIMQNKSQLFHQNNTNENNEQEANRLNRLKDNIKTSKFASLSVPRLNSFKIMKPATQDFETIPRVYRIFQSKIRQTYRKSQVLYRKDSECFKEIRTLPLNYQQFKINQNQNNQILPAQSKSNGKIMNNPQRFYSRKEQPKYKQDINQMLRKTLKTPAVCNRIRNIVKQNMTPNIQRRYSVPMGFSKGQYGYNYYERSRSELRKTSISFRPNAYTVQQMHERPTNKKKFVIRIQKKHILDKVLEKYHD